MAFPDAKQRFSTRAADYARYRPGYPPGVLEILREECGLRCAHVIADVGSGTGLLSKLFLENGNRVFGVEPNEEMRRRGEEFLRGYANFVSVAGSAEVTMLPESSMDFVSAGQSFHWFDAAAARQEFARVLRPRGWVVLVWNDRRIGESALGRECEELLERVGTNYRCVIEAHPEEAQMAEFFGAGRFAARELPNFRLLDFDGLSGWLRSSSYAPREEDARYALMMKALHEIFDHRATNGRVRIDYATQIHFGRLEDDEPRRSLQKRPTIIT